MSRKTAMRDAVVQRLEQGQVRKTGSTDQGKRQKRDQMFFAKGVDLGAQLMKARIINSVAGLDYGASYYVPPVASVPVDPAVAVPGDSSGDPLPANCESDSLPA